MKKYWKSTAIIAVIVLSIGTFYVNSALSATQHPEFVINNQSGNAEEIKSLVLQGSYHEERNMNYANLKITADGSDNRSDGSIIDQIFGSPAPMIMKLQEEHRHFMRGKGYAIESFFENNQLLAFAEVEYKMGSLSSRDFKFAISILDKGDGSTTSFTINVPDSTGVDYIIVEDVQMVDNKLKLITQNMIRANDKFSTEKRIYTIDVSAKQVSSQETIISIPDQSDDTHVDARLIKTNPTREYEKLLFLKTESKITQQRESDHVEQSNRELISYNLRTKEKETIDLPENLIENQMSFFDGSIIYLTEFSEQQLIVTPFSVETNQVVDEFTVELTGATNSMESPIMTVKDGKLFATTMITDVKAKARVIVVDLSTGETLFTGEVEMKDAPKDMEEFELYIHNMSVK